VLLQVWAGCKRGAVVYVWGVPVPSRFSWVPALALVSRHAQQPGINLHVAPSADARSSVTSCFQHTGALLSMHTVLARSDC
jgi:hypothetical protein